MWIFCLENFGLICSSKSLKNVNLQILDKFMWPSALADTVDWSVLLFGLRFNLFC